MCMRRVAVQAAPFVRTMRIYRVAEELPRKPVTVLSAPAFDAWSAAWGPAMTGRASLSGGRAAPVEAPPASTGSGWDQRKATVQTLQHRQDTPDTAAHAGEKLKPVKGMSSDNPPSGAWEAAKEAATKAGENIRAAKDAVLESVADGLEATKQAASKLTGNEELAGKGRGVGPGWQADPEAATDASARAAKAGQDEQWNTELKGSPGSKEAVAGEGWKAAKGLAEAREGEGWENTAKAAEKLKDWEALQEKDDLQDAKARRERNYPHAGVVSGARQNQGGAVTRDV